ncbi:MAG: hypothetical protein PHX21_13750 [bacterium]|nr:hypothetical protein [bacterium]
MRKIIYILALIFIPILCQAGNKYYPNSYDVAITTTPKIVANELLNRKYFLAVNLNTNYNVRIASFPVKPTDTGGIRLNKKGSSNLTAGGHYEDSYFVCVSTWYGVIDDATGTGTISITEKE